MYYASIQRTRVPCLLWRAQVVDVKGVHSDSRHDTISIGTEGCTWYAPSGQKRVIHSCRNLITFLDTLTKARCKNLRVSLPYFAWKQLIPGRKYIRFFYWLRTKRVHKHAKRTLQIKPDEQRSRIQHWNAGHSASENSQTKQKLVKQVSKVWVLKI